MNTNRIEEIQKSTAYPESHSVRMALLQVWNEVGQEYEAEVKQLKAIILESRDNWESLVRDYERENKVLRAEIDRLDKQLNRSKEQLKIYQQAINKIDDYFEYRFDSTLDKSEVMPIIGSITEKLRNKEKSNGE